VDAGGIRSAGGGGGDDTKCRRHPGLHALKKKKKTSIQGQDQPP
jgi:hypothetical protein